MIRVVLVVGTFALLWYGDHLLRTWGLKMAAEFRLPPLWQLWAALTVFFLAGLVVAVAARFPFPRPRFAWGRLALAALLLLPAAHLTLWYRWPHPGWLFRYVWIESIAQMSTVLAGVAIGCGFGARSAPDPTQVRSQQGGEQG